MSLPYLGQAKVDKILTQFSQKYTNDEYIANLILPTITVKEKTGKYAKYGSEHLKVYGDALFRAPGTRANTFNYTVSQGTYSCRERSQEQRIPDEMMANTDDPYDAKRDGTTTALDILLNNKENELATLMTSTAVLTQNTTLSGTDQWSDPANSDPFDDIATGVETVRAATGKIPNAVVMNFDVMQKLKMHPDVREQLKYTGAAGNVSDEAFVSFLKGFWRLKNVYVGTSIKDSADEGQSASLGNIWGDDFVLFYQTSRPTFMQATFGYTFMDLPTQADTYREETHVSDVVRVRMSYDQNIMDASLAYLIKSAIA